MIPAPVRSAATGVTGVDIAAPGRGWINVDFAVQDKRKLRLMVVAEKQKAQLLAGRQLPGEPLVRIDIQGPETASHSARVTQGNYFLAFLNRESTSFEVVYRTSFRGF